MKEQKQDCWWAFLSNRNVRIAAIFVIIFAASCAASRSYSPTEEQVAQMQEKVPGITPEKARAGYAIYSANCGGCHRLYAPGDYTKAQWEKILPRMYTKAKLTGEEEKIRVRDYLYALSK